MGHFGPGLFLLLNLDPLVPPDLRRHNDNNRKCSVCDRVFWLEQFTCVHACVVSEAARIRVDPIYAALRYGTSLAQMSRSSFGSLSESPTRSLV